MTGLRGWVGVTDEELQMVGMPYPQRYAWVMRFDENGTIVQVGRLNFGFDWLFEIQK